MEPSYATQNLLVFIPKITIVADTSNIPQSDVGNYLGLYVPGILKWNAGLVPAGCCVPCWRWLQRTSKKFKGLADVRMLAI